MSAMSIVSPFRTQDDLRVLLAAVTAIDVYQIRRYRLPPLYESGIRYQRETCLATGVPETCERFLTALQLLAERVGDCDDLAPYRAAEWILRGVMAKAEPMRTNIGWHVVVLLPDGSREDPSKRLGM